MENLVKIIIAGLDNAGKTSILTALDKKYDFQKEIVSLSPTIRVEYHATQFLNNTMVWWDMGGQKQYRELYQQKQDLYFDGTDLLLYIIDIQDNARFDTSLDYLDLILSHFIKSKLDVPLVISFHKFDPELRNNADVLNNIEIMKVEISNAYPSFKILFQETSIYDIISVIQLVSYGLSIFDDQFFVLSRLSEKYVHELDCKSFIVFNKNGIILSEYYNETIEPEIYVELVESIKEHLFLLKRMQEENFETEFDFSSLGGELISYLHRLRLEENSFFISIIIKEALKEKLLEKFQECCIDIRTILNSLIS